MIRILAVMAHPDDENVIAGTLAHYAQNGAHIALVCATRGEAGEISDPSLATAETLGAVRESELRCSCEVIGIAELHLLNYCDSGMQGTSDNEKVTAFIQADPDEVRGKLVKIIRDVRPQVIITFEPSGWYGHPDHIATGRYASEAYHLAGDPAAYPDSGDPWRPQRLFHVAFLRSSFKVVVDYVREHGLDMSVFDSFSIDEPDPLEAAVTHVVDVGAYAEIKEASLRCHWTQFGDSHPFWLLPPDVVQAAMVHEHFIQVHPAMKSGDRPASDLFAGID